MDRPLDPSPATAGTVVGGRYRLERRVASGGMASVWEGHDEVLARSVAVKVLHPHLGADEQFVARFKREALAAARLTHPSIVSIYDTCSEQGTEAIVMELIRGTTLRAELDRRGRFPAAEAAHIVAEVADALACAHDAGIVHRDVKPANVLLSHDGRVLVADFGIAKAGDGLDLTGTDTTLGTAKYLAPEQVDPAVGPVDARADVYAAGVILYELLCGRPPFVADTEAATAFARLHRDPPRPRDAVAELDPAVESVVLRAMARDPDARFPSAAALRDALRSVAQGTPPPDGPPTAAVAPVPGDATAVVTTATDATMAGPAATSAPAGAAAPAGKQPRRPRRWAPAVVSVLVLGALAVVGVLWAGTGDGGGPESAAPDAPAAGGGVAIAAIHSFDPQDPDGGVENEDDVGLVTDGDPATSWRTSCYSTPAFGNLKDGLGIVVDLGAAREVHEVRVDSPTPGWSAEVLVAAEAGAERGEWGDPAGAATGGAGTTTVPLDGAEGRFVLLWFTALGDTPSPSCSRNPFGVSVSELAVV